MPGAGRPLKKFRLIVVGPETVTAPLTASRSLTPPPTVVVTPRSKFKIPVPLPPNVRLPLTVKVPATLLPPGDMKEPELSETLPCTEPLPDNAWPEDRMNEPAVKPLTLKVAPDATAMFVE